MLRYTVIVIVIDHLSGCDSLTKYDTWIINILYPSSWSI